MISQVNSDKMEEKKPNEITPLLLGTESDINYRPTYQCKDYLVIEMTETADSASKQNESTNVLNKGDREQFLKKDNAAYSNIRLDGDDSENQTFVSKPSVTKADHDIPLRQNILHKEKFVTESEKRRSKIEDIIDNENNETTEEECSHLVDDDLNTNGGIDISVNSKERSRLDESVRLIGDHSNCELLILSLKHMLKVILTTSPVILLVCTIGFGFSRLPYTTNCEEFWENITCTYYNDKILYGVNHVGRLVSFNY